MKYVNFGKTWTIFHSKVHKNRFLLRKARVCSNPMSKFHFLGIPFHNFFDWLLCTFIHHPSSITGNVPNFTFQAFNSIFLNFFSYKNGSASLALKCFRFFFSFCESLVTKGLILFSLYHNFCSICFITFRFSHFFLFCEKKAVYLISNLGNFAINILIFLIIFRSE